MKKEPKSTGKEMNKPNRPQNHYREGNVRVFRGHQNYFMVTKEPVGQRERGIEPNVQIGRLSIIFDVNVYV